MFLVYPASECPASQTSGIAAGENLAHFFFLANFSVIVFAFVTFMALKLLWVLCGPIWLAGCFVPLDTKYPKK
jgi:hypothetical protein